MADKEPSQVPPAAGSPLKPPYRVYALVLFWGGLLFAGINPPGPAARVATIVATVGALWYVGLRLNRTWRRVTRNRL